MVKTPDICELPHVLICQVRILTREIAERVPFEPPRATESEALRRSAIQSLGSATPGHSRDRIPV